MPDNQRIAYLLEKYGTGQCTAQELNELSDWYEELSLPGHEDLMLEEQSSETREMAQQYYHKLKDYLESTGEMGAPRTKRKALWYWAAAAIMLFLLGGASYYLQHRDSPQSSVVAVARDTLSNDWLRLPDGTVIVLKQGSRLTYDSSSYGKQNREVTLHGEAYFDVVHNERIPFIVHAGNVRTTVLGTAFTIRTAADGKNVSVSVTRGKVKVEDMQQHRMPTVLTKGKAVDYTASSSGQSKIPPVPVIRDFPVEEAVQWVAADLQFESIAFSAVAKRLSVRYHTVIRLANPDIGKCVVSMTAPFEGTESLEQVLTVLCGTLNDTYRITDTGVLIEGDGCTSN